MIYESSYWKDDLLKLAQRLRRCTSQKRWSEVSLARVEQTIMLGFYSIRRLAEAKKLSDATVDQLITLRTHRHLGKDVTLRNWDRIDTLYDLATNGSEQRQVLYLCHQIVHSYVFSVAMNENNGLDGFFFTSDRQRHTCLYYLPAEAVIALFEQVGNDYPSSMELRFNPARRDYDVTSGHPTH